LKKNGYKFYINQLQGVLRNNNEKKLFETEDVDFLVSILRNDTKESMNTRVRKIVNYFRKSKEVVKQPSAQGKPTVISATNGYKVYCKNCRYFVGQTTAMDGKCLNSCSYQNFTNDLVVTRCYKLNHDGNCEHYKRKWYKFGVK